MMPGRAPQFVILILTALGWLLLDRSCAGLEPGQQQLSISAATAIQNSVGMKFTYIPPGAFHMGSPPIEPARDAEESLHRVQITAGFFIAIHEVTQRHYELVMDANPSQFAPTGGFAERVEDSDHRLHPVDSVSWHDAVAFCERLSALAEERAAGRRYRLPTESEWEYACRAGSRSIWHFGKDARQLEDHAWYRHQPWQPHTHPVGQKLPNQWGLYDMYGNVWEWCADWHEKNYYAHSPVQDPTGPTQGTTKVIRGGSWYSPPASCRSAARRSDPPQVGDPDTGFRVVCVQQVTHTDFQPTDD